MTLKCSLFSLMPFLLTFEGRSEVFIMHMKLSRRFQTVRLRAFVRFKGGASPSDSTSCEIPSSCRRFLTTSPKRARISGSHLSSKQRYTIVTYFL